MKATEPSIVTGTVSEYVPSADPQQPPLTELTSPSVVLLGTGATLPTPVALGATLPDPTGAYDQLERLEGMRVSVGTLEVTGPTLGNINEPNNVVTSTGVFYGVVSGLARPSREERLHRAHVGVGEIAPEPSLKVTRSTVPEETRVVVLEYKR